MRRVRKYTADISDIAPNDANGEGDFAYSWHASTDGGTNYDLISGATLELYTLALSDFAGANANAEVHLRVSVVHTDFGGFDQKLSGNADSFGYGGGWKFGNRNSKPA